MKKFFMRISLCVFLLSLTSTQVWAYLDPGTGSLIFQTVIGVVLAVLATGKLWFFRVKTFLRNLFGDKKNDE